MHIWQMGANRKMQFSGSVLQIQFKMKGVIL